MSGCFLGRSREILGAVWKDFLGVSVKISVRSAIGTPMPASEYQNRAPVLVKTRSAGIAGQRLAEDLPNNAITYYNANKLG